MLREAVAKASLQQLLPIAGIALLVVMVVVAVVSLWAGNRWAEGAQALQDRKQDQLYIEQLQGEAEQLRQIAVNSTLDYANAADRMDAIATQLETDREANRKFQQAQRAELEQLLRNRPDLRDGRAGDDVLQHWNRSNQGPASAEPAAGTERQPAGGMPGPAAGDLGRLGGTAGQPRPGNGSVSRLPGFPVAPGAGLSGVPAHGLAVVLQGTGAGPAARVQS